MGVLMIKVYFVNGFLESGKTTFITELLRQEYFQSEEKILLLLCEEGEVEYDTELLGEKNITLVNIEDEANFNPEYITNIEKDIKPKTVIIEYNGMWNRKDLQFPWYWDDVLEITLYDASTFELYVKNMKSLVSEQVRNAKMVLFNKCDSVMQKLPGFRRSVKAVNSNLNVVFKDEKGEINPRFDEDLPYDLHAHIINVYDESFGIFYVDAMDDVDRYLGKEVIFTGMVMKKSKEQKDTCIIGRFAMTCCADDLSLFGFICDYEKTEELELDDWVNVRAVIDKDFAEKYNLWYPVLTVISIEKCQVPQKEIVEVY